MKKLHLVSFCFLLSLNAYSQAIIVDHNSTKTEQIPHDYLQEVRNTLHIAYGHTSHGSQLITGMVAIESSWGEQYAFSSAMSENKLEMNESLGGDVGYYPQWLNNTISFLEDENNSRFNVIMWSWCGQLSSMSEQEVWDHYLSPMNQLENDYPAIQFVYFTGHLDGSGVDGTLNVNNEIIRSYCNENGKILYDFADIESYDPDGYYYLDKKADDACNYDTNNDGSKDGNWAVEWCATNPESHLITGSCAHSEGLNCEYKGRAAWWLYSRLVGWSGAITKVNFPDVSDEIFFNYLTKELVVPEDIGDNINCSIYSISGKMIDHISLDQSIRLSYLKNGIYFICISGIDLRKIVKIEIY